MIDWGKYVGDLEWVVRGIIFIFALEFWKTINKLKKEEYEALKLTG